MNTGGFNRPGVSDAFLAAAGCAHIDGNECARLYGFKAAGIVIPFRLANGSPVDDGDRPFARVRLYESTDEQKYHQRPGSGVHLYIPPGFAEMPKGAPLLLVEGEFKAASLAEAGFAALGLCGLCGACRSITDGDERRHVLQDGLVALLETHRPARVVFLGDADVVCNAQFAAEAAKLRNLIRGTTRFRFVENVLAAKPPVGGPKGIDDCRQQHGDKFNSWFEKLLAEAYDIPPKATPAEVFAEFLRREAKPVEKLLAAKGHEGQRARVRLLQSAALLWNEPAAKLLLAPLLRQSLRVSKTEIATLIKDAASHRNGADDATRHARPGASPAQGSAVLLPSPEPWPNPVDGAEVLARVAGTYSRYLVLPSGGADAMALWTAHTHAFEAFLHTPRLNFSSPEKGCGKSTALDVMETMVSRPLKTSSMTCAVLFRVVAAHKPTLLLDELDAYIKTHEELRGLIDDGHKRGAQAIRLEGEDHVPRAFAAYAPAALAGIGHLPATLHDRSIVIRLTRAKPGELAARFDSRHTEAETVLCRKLARWAADHAEALAACDPALPAGAYNRIADNWRPLFAIALVAGGDWPRRAAEAYALLTARDDLDAQGIGTMLLADIAELYATTGTDKLPSVEVAKALAEMEGREWAEWGKARKPISPNQLAKQLRRFDVRPRTIKLAEGQTAKGYHREQFSEAFAQFLPTRFSKRNPVTIPPNTGDSALSETSPETARLRIENAIFPRENGPGYGVTGQKAPETQTEATKEEVLL